jgi:hypothetical protein
MASNFYFPPSTPPHDRTSPTSTIVLLTLHSEGLSNALQKLLETVEILLGLVHLGGDLKRRETK